MNNFEIRSFYKIIPKFSIGGDHTVALEWTKERTFDEKEAQFIKEEIEREGQCIVTHCENKETNRNKPEALNTVGLLKLCSQ